MNREDVILDLQERYRKRARSLNEVERRQWAAVEAMKLGRGGMSIVSQALRISRNTIRKGIREVATGQADSDSRANAQIRRPGGGRKSKKTAMDRLTGKGSTPDLVVTEPEFQASESLDETRQDLSPIASDLDPIPVHDRRADSAPGSRAAVD